MLDKKNLWPGKSEAVLNEAINNVIECPTIDTTAIMNILKQVVKNLTQVVENLTEKRFDTSGAAEYLGVAKQTMNQWRTCRRGPDYILMGRKVIYLKSDLDKYTEAKRIKITR
jgi:hypothetical protein